MSSPDDLKLRCSPRHSAVFTRRAPALLLTFFAIFLVAGCAYRAGALAKNDPQDEVWTGRISLRVASEPPQAFFAGFELKGKPETGQLTLTSPIGSVVGLLRWSGGEAVLQSGNDVRRFDSVDALLESTTGAALPVNALFDWLKGKSTSERGWSADLSRYDSGRIDAVRTEPAPQTNLKIVLDQ